MKKRLFCIGLASVMLIGSFAPTHATAGVETLSGVDAATSISGVTTSVSAVTTSNSAVTTSESGVRVLKEPVKLSLKEALVTMKTKGVRAETAQLNKKSDVAVANGYSEKASTIKKTLEGLDKLDAAPDAYLTSIKKTRSDIMQMSYDAQVAGATQNNKKILTLRRSFALDNQENNYQADMNKIEQETIKMYYTVLLAEDNYKIAKDNLTVQQKNLKTINAKKSVGLLSKKDVLQSQSALMEAEKEVRTAKTKMEYAHMSFNYLLGFEVMQEVVFTDKLVETTDSGITADLAVANAQKNRNEIRGANFAKDIYRILLNEVGAYPKSSSTYLNAQLNLLSAEKISKDAWTQIEIDVRNRKAEAEDKKAALQAAKALQCYAEEGVRLVTLTNEEGLSTVDELLGAQVNLYKAKLNVAKAISDYNISLNELKDAQGIGTMRIPL